MCQVQRQRDHLHYHAIPDSLRPHSEIPRSTFGEDDFPTVKGGAMLTAVPALGVRCGVAQGTFALPVAGGFTALILVAYCLP